VDDLIIFAKDIANINDLRAQLNEEYEMKDLGELKYFLGIQVHFDGEWKIINVNQSGYNRMTVPHGEQQTSEYSSLQPHLAQQSNENGRLDGSKEVSKHSR
jgi:hypothetical protein